MSSPEIPGFKIPDYERDTGLGLPWRLSPTVRRGVGETLKGAYVAGGVQGYSIGQTVGYAAGHVVGVLEGAGTASIFFGLILFTTMIFRRLPPR
jgi:hypothetical protein